MRALEILKAQSIQERLDAPKKQYPRYAEIQQKIDKEFGMNSQESIYIQLYKICPKRNDFGKIQVANSNNLIPETGNFINLQSKYVMFRDYNKTSKTYGDIQQPLNENLMKKILINLRKNPRELLFEFPVQNHSIYIKRILNSVGYEDGNITWLRHSVMSQPMTTEERVDIAKVAGHSIKTNLETYKGLLQPEELEDED
jgi:hypothetical protein